MKIFPQTFLLLFICLGPRGNHNCPAEVAPSPPYGVEEVLIMEEERAEEEEDGARNLGLLHIEIRSCICPAISSLSSAFSSSSKQGLRNRNKLFGNPEVGGTRAERRIAPLSTVTHGTD